MKLLVIGGTVFVGRNIVEKALENGHEVTILHRGKSPHPPEWKVSEVLADRDGGLAALGDGPWDAVVDCVGYVPRIVRDSAEFLKDRTRLYLYISSISIYEEGKDGEPFANYDQPPVIGEEITGETYGKLKLECEKEVNKVYQERSIIVRPGIVAGAFDPTNRFTYWADRFGRYESVLVPGLPDCPIQVVDSRDLGAFCVQLLEDDRTGIFNACGPIVKLKELVEVGENQGIGVATWVDWNLLSSEGLQLGRDFPLCTEPKDYNTIFKRINNQPSFDAGLILRPFHDTFHYTLQWSMHHRELPPVGSTRTGTVGLERTREEELLQKYQDRS